MAALFQPDVSSHSRPSPSRPRLELIEGGSSRVAAARSAHPSRGVYWRRRLAVLVAFAAASLLVVSALSGPAGSTPSTDSAVPASYVVRPGDTLWGIAHSFGLGGDVRETIAELADANGGAAIHSGQSLVIPRSLRR